MHQKITTELVSFIVTYITHLFTLKIHIKYLNDKQFSEIPPESYPLLLFANLSSANSKICNYTLSIKEILANFCVQEVYCRINVSIKLHVDICNMDLRCRQMVRRAIAITRFQDSSPPRKLVVAGLSP